MERFIRLLCRALIAVVVTWSTASQADHRVALVIGNGAYKNVPELPNPPKDAKAMAALLRNLGFDVVSGQNLTHATMTDVLRKFADEADGADVALFFYAGHGLQLDGKNYLLPVDANPKSELDVKLGGSIDVNVLLDQTMPTAKVKLVFLDACRDNPFVEKITRSMRSRSVTIGSGLAEMKSGEGTMLAFATAPGQVALDGQGAHSPFTKALLDNLSAPNEEISVALTKVRAEVAELTQKKQSPWTSTNLTGLFYMNKTVTPEAEAKIPADGVTQPVATASGGDAVEMEFWRSVKDSYKPEELNAYLTRYPNGSFSSIARARLASLQDSKQNPINARALTTTIDPAVHSAESSRQTEDALDLERVERIEIQKRLKALGFETNTNGRFTDQTRHAIMSWQGARNYPASGFLNKLQLDALRSEEVQKSALTASEDEDSRPARHETRSRHRHLDRSTRTNNPAAAMGTLFGGVAHGLFGGR